METRTLTNIQKRQRTQRDGKYNCQKRPNDRCPNDTVNINKSQGDATKTQVKEGSFDPSSSLYLCCSLYKMIY